MCIYVRICIREVMAIHHVLYNSQNILKTVNGSTTKVYVYIHDSLNSVKQTYLWYSYQYSPFLVTDFWKGALYII